MNEKEVRDKIEELQARREIKLDGIEQTEKIKKVFQMDIMHIDGALIEFKKMLPGACEL